MLIDTHAHLDFPQFDQDRNKIIQRAKKASVKTILNVGTSLKNSRKSIELTQKHDNIYASVGLHPHEATHFDTLEYRSKAAMPKNLAKHLKVVAIGECGLDYYRLPKDKKQKAQLKEKQKKLFKAQLGLAQELSLPVIIHNRNAHQDVIHIIKQTINYQQSRPEAGQPATEAINNFRGVFHCFSGDKNFLQQVLDLGFYIGFCGNLTFKNAKNLQEIAKIAPLEKILLETDSPFLSPEPFRGKRNEPKNVKIIAEFLAQLKGIPFEKFVQTTTQNAEKLFNL